MKNLVRQVFIYLLDLRLTTTKNDTKITDLMLEIFSIIQTLRRMKFTNAAYSTKYYVNSVNNLSYADNTVLLSPSIRG